ncbi:MAG TPA: PIN/TRAM domain-containing protein [Moorella mulderi]|nr:PIN/TRAM domain-containing protein [Moorella mulderi]
MGRRILKGTVTLAAALLGFYLSQWGLSFWENLRGQPLSPGLYWSLVALGVALSGMAGGLLAWPCFTFIWQGIRWIEDRLQKIPLQEILSGALGLISGLIIANLIGTSFYRLPWIGPYISMVANLLLGYLGWSVGSKRREDIWALFTYLPRRGSRDKKEEARACPKILDTSVIIDGRIADIIKTGFIEGTIIIPAFVLEELRHIADSPDSLRRNRGRRGLDILNKIRKETGITVKVVDTDFEDLTEVDSKLVRLAQKLSAAILTNDYNLNKVAELQGVKVLNINELANAIKPVVLPGEEMTVQIIKDGKEMGQGVAYLDDGTMIVIENGRRYMGQTIPVQVTSVLQTAAGRMIFARPKVQESSSEGGYRCLS